MQQVASAIAIATGENWNQTQLNINFNCVFIKYLFSIEYQFVSEVTIVTIVFPDDKATKLNGHIVTGIMKTPCADRNNFKEQLKQEDETILIE